MAVKRVIAYAMHEHEIALASQVLADAQSTESFVLGSADDTEIETLRTQGLVVEILPQSREEPTGLDFVEFMARSREINGPWVGRQGEFTYFLSLRGPLLEPWRDAMQRLGVVVLERDMSGAFKVRITEQQRRQLSDLDFVDALRPVVGEDSAPQLTELSLPRDRDWPGATARAMLTFDLRVTEADDLLSVVSWLNARRIPVAGASGRKIRIHLLENSPYIDQIPVLDGVATMEEYLPPDVHNDVARRLITVEPSTVGPPTFELTGANQIVGVADTGLDATHPDFAGRIVARVALGGLDADDPHGHGTHVTGSILGDGAASGGQYRGVAPAATVYFQALLGPNNKLTGLPLDLGDLFSAAYANGARIHNNSWGSATQSRYTMGSLEVDEFVAKHRDMLVVFSAGNDGSGASPQNAATGFVDWLSIGSPASSKNALTVGASRSDRTSGGWSTLSHSQAWPPKFPKPPIASDTVSGDPEAIAGFSSRGPCDDRRIKPDLVAPGTDIISARSALAPPRRYWGPVSGHGDHYAFWGGTSMAAPLVSGCAALAREYYQTVRQHHPSAALLKATLINGTRWLNAIDAIAPDPGMPNYHQGFGRVDMTGTLPNREVPALRLEFDDRWQAGDGLKRTGDRRRFELVLGPSVSSLRISMVYTDLPARALQNNLNLIVEGPDGVKVPGNAQAAGKLRSPDPENNVEIVRLDQAPPGNYLLQVSAQNLLKGPQDFALVVTSSALVSFKLI